MICSIKNQLNVHDRGLAYGDGLFETIACIDGVFHNWDRHWQRLLKGAERLSIKLPDEAVVMAQMEAELAEMASASKQGIKTNWVIKIIVTRGSGGRGYLFPENPQTTLIVTVHAWPERDVQDYHLGIEAKLCQTCLAQQPALAGIKHLNRLEQVLGRNELTGHNVQEGLMLACSEANFSVRENRFNDFVIEGTSSNLFFVRDAKLCTPKIETCGVRGTLRDEILSLAKQLKIEFKEAPFTLQQLEGASEVFFCNSIFGILPVSKIHINDMIHWQYAERTLTNRLALIINRALKRPERFNLAL